MGRRADPQQQTCKACRQPEKFDFVVPDEIWAAVVPEKYRGLALCLYCFDEFAREAGVDYAQSVKAVYFAGAKGTFVFTVTAAVDA